MYFAGINLSVPSLFWMCRDGGLRERGRLVKQFLPLRKFEGGLLLNYKAKPAIWLRGVLHFFLQYNMPWISWKKLLLQLIRCMLKIIYYNNNEKSSIINYKNITYLRSVFAQIIRSNGKITWKILLQSAVIKV